MSHGSTNQIAEDIDTKVAKEKPKELLERLFVHPKEITRGTVGIKRPLLVIPHAERL
jgi:hypothetical protein